MSSSIKLNHPQTFDDVNPDYDIKDKLRAYRSILNAIRAAITIGKEVDKFSVHALAGIHLKNATFMLGFTLTEIGSLSPYGLGETSRQMGEKIIVEPQDIGFKFKELPPSDEIEFYDFLRSNLDKLLTKLNTLYPPLSIFNSNPFVYFDRAIQEIALSKAYIGEALFKVASKRDDYAIAKLKNTPNTVAEPSQFKFQPTR